MKIWILLCHFSALTLAIELTFELPDNQNQCFYEEIAKETESTIEYQVVTGGQYDVDVELQSASGQVLYKEIRKQYDSYTWKAESSGTYKVCFSNEFSTFSHKIIYFDWQIGSEKSIVPTKASMTAMTLMESAAVTIHEKLKVVDDLQTHQRLRENNGRKSAEDLNDRVMLWSIGQSVIMVCIGVGQVMVLKSFFSDKRPISGRF